MNLGTVIVLSIIGLMLFYAVRTMIKNRGKGCNGNCGSCSQQCKNKDFRS